MVHDVDDGGKYGTPYKHDPEFTGPNKNRSCTDIVFLILFILFLVAWGFIAVYAVKKGSSDRILMPIDSRGRRCGRDSEVLDKPYLFFFDLTACANPNVLLHGCTTPQICVSECPTKSWASFPYRSKTMPFNVKDVQNSIICRNEQIKAEITTVEQLVKRVEDKSCADWYVSSRPVYNRCLPSPEDISGAHDFVKTAAVRATTDNVLEELAQSTNHIQEASSEFGENVVSDLENGWKLILASLLLAIVVSILYIALLRWMAGIMTWFSLIAVIALILTAAVLCVRRYIYLRDYGPDPVTGGYSVKGQAESIGNSKELFLVLSIILCIISAIALIVIIFLRKRIQIAIALIKEGSKAVSNVIASLFFPLIPWCFQIIVLVWTAFVWFNLTTVGEQVFKAQGMADGSCKCSGEYQSIKNNDICDPTIFKNLCHNSTNGGECTSSGCHFFEVDSPPLVTYFHIYNIFGAFWGIWFLFGLADMILAGTFAKWYWTFNKKDVPFFAVTRSAAITISYHLGTIAFGSLIISICSFIRAILEYAEKKISKYENAIMKAMFCCLKCFFWCLEKFLRFINRNAYIMCAIHGKNFCLSAKDAFNLLMRNILRVVVLDRVTAYLFFIGKLMITGIMVGATYMVVFYKKSTIYHYDGAVPLTAIGIGSYIMASIFFGVYSVAVDTLFLCFLEDCERNDGSQEKPYFMSKNLMQVLGKTNMKRK